MAYAQCIRSHGVSNFPDPVQTPNGGYGYRTTGIDPNSAAFQGALQACKVPAVAVELHWPAALPAQQQAWLNWAQCIRTHGVPDFPDPTFSGSEVHDSGIGVELAAAAVGDGRMQVADAVRRWSGRVTGTCRSES